MITLNIIGGIGSGKSLVTNILTKLNVPVYEADSAAKQIIENDKTVKNKIIDLLGADSYDLNQKYYKIYVAKLVFNNSDLLSKLNAIVHPAVAKDYEEWLLVHKNTPIIAKETAILNFKKQTDLILLVTSPIELRLKRIKLRDPHRSESQIDDIIKNQKSDIEFRQFTDFEIVNDEKSLIFPQVFKILESIK